jgi:hypothetical protein
MFFKYVIHENVSSILLFIGQKVGYNQIYLLIGIYSILFITPPLKCPLRICLVKILLEENLSGKNLVKEVKILLEENLSGKNLVKEK